MRAGQQFAVPQPYFVRDERETQALEQEAAELRALIADAGTEWRTRENAASRLHEIERVLKASELGKRLVEREARPAVHQQPAPGGPVAVNAASAQQYMEPVFYYATNARRTFVVNVASGVMGAAAA